MDQPICLGQGIMEGTPEHQGWETRKGIKQEEIQGPGLAV